MDRVAHKGSPIIVLPGTYTHTYIYSYTYVHVISERWNFRQEFNGENDN